MAELQSGLAAGHFAAAEQQAEVPAFNSMGLRSDPQALALSLLHPFVSQACGVRLLPLLLSTISW